MKKNTYLLLCIFLFLVMVPKVNASRGEVRYHITNVNISDSDISFSGWAFMHRTQNGRDANGNNTHQKIAIKALYNGGTEEKVVDGGGDYNFYCQHYYNTWRNGRDCVNDYNIPQYNGCVGEGGDSDCYYENIGFTINFDVTKWNLKEGETVSFQIKVCNDSYGCSQYVDLGVTNNADVVKGSSKIKVYSSSSNTVKFIATEAMFRKPTNLDETYDIGGSKIIGQVRGLYTIDTSYTDGYRFINGYKSSEYKNLGKDSGYYILKTTKGNNSVSTPCNGSDCQARAVPTSWVVPASRFVISIGDASSCEFGSKSVPFECNSSAALYDTCNDHYSVNSSFTGTYSGYNASCTSPTDPTSVGSSTYSYCNHSYVAYAKITIKQNSSVSNITSPTNLYAGGGFSTGFSFLNSFSWQYDVKPYYVHAYKVIKKTLMEGEVDDLDNPICCDCPKNDTNNDNSGKNNNNTKNNNNGKSKVEKDSDSKKNIWGRIREAIAFAKPIDNEIKGCSCGTCGYHQKTITYVDQTEYSDSKTCYANSTSGGETGCDKDSYDKAKKAIEDVIEQSIYTNDELETVIKDSFRNVSINGNLIEMRINNCSKVIIEDDKDSSIKEFKIYCEISLPAYGVENYTGKVGLDSNDTKYNISNKYYTELNPKEYQITNDSITGLNRIKEGNPAGIIAGNWGASFSCKVSTYALLKDNNYKFIYRPIDVVNPFPDRNAGFNWYDWISDSKNKERLANSYNTDSDYIFNLDNNKVAEIKQYNKSRNYLDWTGIDEREKSEFVEKYRAGGSK